MANKHKRRSPASKRAATRKRAKKNEHRRDRGPTRQQRWEAERRQKRHRRILQRTAAGVVVVALVAGVGAWQVNKRRNENRAIAALTKGTCKFDRKSDVGRVNEHAAKVAFDVEPPSGGVHDGTAAVPGTFEANQAPPDGQIVHAMEHGDIVIWHRELSNEDLESLRSLVDSRPDDVFLVSRPSLPTAIAATGWHKRLLCEDLESSALRSFISRYADKGPERQPE